MSQSRIMFIIEKSFHFEAGHELKFHDGKCQKPHGHSYQITVRLKSNTLINDGPKKNMVIDFLDISSVVKPMIEKYFDHKWLNETLNSDSPTSEYIASWIYHYLSDKLPHLNSVTVQETRSSSVTYYTH